jgi:hypothetical protein
MFMRYLHLAILASAAASVLSQSAPEPAAGDMVARQLAGVWALMPEDGFPQIDFDSSEALFKFNFTGTLTTTKFLEVNLYQSDCEGASDASLAFTEGIVGDNLDVDVEIIQANIGQSVHYQDVGVSQGSIGFCLRVDYNYIDADDNTESINFYETNVTITVDLTSNFTLTGITLGRTAADSEAADAELDYPVEAYICLDDNSEVTDPDPLAQGSILQVCIKIDDSVTTENILVEDILTFVITQPDSTNTETSYPVTNTVADPLTDKTCRESGICNVKNQLVTKFFVDTNPGDLRVDGVAILAFGKASLMPSSAPTDARRRLRVPIKGLLTGDDVKAFMAAQQQRQQDSNEAAIVSVAADSSQRMLQAGAAQSDFGLQVGLQGIEGVGGDSSSQDSSSSGGSAIVVAVIVLIMLAAGCGFGFFFCTKRRARKEEIDVNKHHQHHSSATSVGTYPSQGSAYTSSSSAQYANYRGSATSRDAEID